MVDPFIGRAPCAAFLCLFHEVGARSPSRPPWVPKDAMSSHPYRLSEAAQPYLEAPMS